MKKKSALLTRSVSGFVLWSLLLLTLFKGQASAGTTEELLEITGKAEPEKVRQLIQGGADVNAKNNLGWTPLMLAAYNNSNPETLLLDAGADVNVKSIDGSTPLVFAALQNSNPESLRVLIKAGADVSTDGSAPLMAAARCNPHPEVLKVLIEVGADANAKSTDGSTPLMIAAIENTPEVLTALLEAGADAKVKNNEGKTALDYAREREALKGTVALKRLEEKTGR